MDKSSDSKKESSRLAEVTRVLRQHEVMRGMTPEKLLQLGYTQDTVDAILSVTRKEGESYADFIARANTNQTGRLVKLADLEDNMDIRRLPDLTEKDWHRLNKYLHAYHYLNHEENDTSLIKE